MYVNDDTVTLAEDAVAGMKWLYSTAFAKNLIPSVPQIDVL
jgi:hypothetical protein